MIHNQLHTVDLVIIGAYLIAMVMVGLVVVRKVKNMDDYYLGGRSFGPLVLMATVCATIIGGMLCGCSRTASAEFTFFLAIPSMFGWGLVKCVKCAAAGLAMTTTEAVVLAVGVVSAFVMSVVSIKFLMGYIKKNDFTAFGWYRIVVGVLVLGYFVFESMGMLP